LAKRDLEHSFELNPNDPNSSSSLMEVGIGLRCPREEMEQYYKNGMRACPWHYGLNYEKLRYLMPKWYGSIEEMFDFGKQCLNVSGEYAYLGFVMVDALNEVHTYSPKGENFLGREDVWPTVEKVYTRFFEKHPDNIRRRFGYAYHAYRAKKYEVALEQFEIIGGRWMMYTNWRSLESYNRCRAFTYVKIGDDYLLAKKLYETAIEYFEKAVQYNPDAYAYCGLGQAYMYSGLRSKNISYLRRAEEILDKAVNLGGPNKSYAKGELEKLRGYMRRI
jgi:tetratricopeptide (TPR) repeat protein